MSIHRYDDGNFFPGSGAPDEVSEDPLQKNFEETMLLSNCISNRVKARQQHQAKVIPGLTKSRVHVPAGRQRSWRWIQRQRSVHWRP